MDKNFARTAGITHRTLYAVLQRNIGTAVKVHDNTTGRMEVYEGRIASVRSLGGMYEGEKDVVVTAADGSRRGFNLLAVHTAVFLNHVLNVHLNVQF